MSNERRAPAAPRHLAAAGRRVWRELHRFFAFEPGDLLLVAELAACVDRIAVCRDQLAREGVVIESTSGAKKRHPGVEAERAARAQLLEIWRVLGLNRLEDDAPRPRPGRPPGGRREKELPTWLQ